MGFRGLFMFVVFILLSSSVLAYDYSKLKKEDYAVNDVIVKFNPSTKIQKFGDAEKIINNLDKDKKKLIKLTGSYQETGYGSNYLYLIEYKKNTDIIKKIEQLSKHSEIEFAEPNLRYALQNTYSNDPRFVEQWYLNNTGQLVGGTNGKVDADIDAPEAWDITTGSFLPPVNIAILDSGIFKDHEDLISKVDNYVTAADVMIKNIIANGCDSVAGEDCDGVAGNDLPFDVSGHGTEMAGIAAASTDNVKGISGVCWNCRIIPVKVCFKSSGGGCFLSDLARGIDYAIKNNAGIVSMSIEGSVPSGVLETMINDSYVNNNTIFVAAAGNGGSNLAVYPASYEKVISVASTNHSDNKRGSSNYDISVDVSAPGTLILTTDIGATNNYIAVSGTSPATAVVSGIIGLMLSRNPLLTNNQTRDVLQNNTDNIDALNPTQCGGSSCAGLIGSGRVNAYKSVLDALAIAPHFTPIENKIVNKGKTIRIQLNASDLNLDPLKYKINLISGTPATAWSFNENTGLFEWFTTDADIGTYKINFSVYDHDIVWGNKYKSQIVNIKVNAPPVINSIFYPNENTITVDASDPDDPPTSLGYSVSGSYATMFTSSGSSFTWNPPPENTASGAIQVPVTVSDPTSFVSAVATIIVGWDGGGKKYAKYCDPKIGVC